jgi:hypothetical protein
LLPLAIDKRIASTGLTAGNVVVPTSGNSRHKRVIGKAYLLVGGSASAPIPLGIRGDHNKRAFNSDEIRLATGKEMLSCFRNLNAAQIKTIVCTLSTLDSFRAALAPVIEDPGHCNCE